MGDNGFDIAMIAATFVVAGMVKGVTGMGLPTVAMGILGALVSPLAAASLLLLPSFITNIWQLLTGPNFGALLKRLWPMMAAIVFGTIASSSVMTGDNAEQTTAALGVVLVCYALFTLLARQLHVPTAWQAWASPLVGFLTGLVTGATGVFVIPAVPYLQALDLDRDELVQALGLSFTVSTVALAGGIFWHGALTSGTIMLSALAVIPALVGMAAGQAIRSRISPPLFRRGFLVCLLLLGSEMAVRPLL